MRNALAIAVILATSALAAPPTAFRVQVAGHGRPMILIPGLSSSGDAWKGTVERYKDRYGTYTVTLAGFAGVPAIESRPLLAAVRDQLAKYIEENHLEKPIVVGHSLGGNVAMDLAATHPDLVGPIVIVDSLPFYANVMFRVDSLDAAKPMLDGMRAQFATLTREQYDAYVKSHASTQFMVTKPSDLDVITEWGLKSDPKAVYDSMLELYGSDLRPSLAKIASPTLVLGTWAGLHDQTKAYGMNLTKGMIAETFRQQYQTLPKLHFAISETSRHFIMFDDPEWFHEQVDAFLANPAAATADRGFTR
ncbi:MAG TPA: alpha/beta hydrolase [Vicinamibacterales bacterium]|nr:alpha/beta hydrolase [Vicinamibacterales bacterium]